METRNKETREKLETFLQAGGLAMKSHLPGGTCQEYVLSDGCEACAE